MRVPALSLRFATALGLVLPLLALPAFADPGAWVDPPKSATKPAVAPKPAEVPAKEAAQAPVKEPAKAAEAPQPTKAARTAPKAEPRETMAAAPPRRHHARRTRLADTPAMGPVPYAPPGRVEAAQALATEYLSVVSAPGEAMVGATQRFYGARVRFYGRPTTMAALLDEKRGFVRRWPERRYAARAFSTQCRANGSSCIVRAIVDFRAANPQRGAISRGASELVLEVSFAGQRPVIVAESGRVLHRDQDRAETLAPSAGRG